MNPRDEVLRQGRTQSGIQQTEKDGRLVPQNHHLIGVWIYPGSFIDQKSNEELKVKRQNGEGEAVRR